MDFDLESERWLPIPGFEGLYEVSDFGRVKSLDRLVPHWASKDGVALRHGKILSPGRSSKYGHLKVKLGSGNKYSQHSCHVHQLVLAAFIESKPDGMEVRHLNGIASDNRLVNLAYGTRKENTADMKLHGTSKIRAQRVSQTKKGIATVWCERHGMAKLTAKEVRSMRDDFAIGMTSAEAGRKYKISPAHASKIRLGQAWSKLETL